MRLAVTLFSALFLLSCSDTDTLTLEEIPIECTAEELISCGFVFCGMNPRNTEPLGEFVSDYLDGKDCTLRLCSYTFEGDLILEELNYSDGKITYRYDPRRDSWDSGGIYEETYSAVVSDGEYIYLSNHSVYGEHFDNRMITPFEYDELKSETSLLTERNSGEDELIVYSPDGKSRLTRTGESEYTLRHNGRRRSMTVANTDVLGIEGFSWSGEYYAVICSVPDGYYYEFVDPDSREIIETLYSDDIREYQNEYGKITIPLAKPWENKS